MAHSELIHQPQVRKNHPFNRQNKTRHIRMLSISRDVRNCQRKVVPPRTSSPSKAWCYLERYNVVLQGRSTASSMFCIFHVHHSVLAISLASLRMIKQNLDLTQPKMASSVYVQLLPNCDHFPWETNDIRPTMK